MARKQQNIVVAVTDQGRQPSKLLRISIATDGSHFIMAPYYHRQLNGALAKIRITPVLLEPGLAGRAVVEEEGAVSTNVKLSLHSSGFVQFSGGEPTRIRSGQTKPFDIPKGLGLHGNAITEPVDTGPTWIAAFFDAHNHKRLDPNERNVEVMTFTEHDMFERDEHDAVSRHVYQIEGFVFPHSLRKNAIYRSGKGWVLEQSYSPIRPEWPAQFRLVDLVPGLAMLGILVSRWHMPLENDPQGYSLFSPRDRTRQFALAAFYPKDVAELPSLEWEPRPTSDRVSS